MRLEDQVISLELAKRLKELGVKQESVFVWINDKFLRGSTSFGIQSVPDDEPRTCSAFTVAELGEMLPVNATLSNGKIHWLRIHKTLEGWVVGYFDNTMPLQFVADTEADSRAKMLCHLIEKGVIRP